MINDWRKKWYENTDEQTDEIFPFGFVQVQTITYNMCVHYELQLAANGADNTTAGYFPELRWSQTADFGYVPNDVLKKVFMAVAIDLGDPDSPHGSVHPRDKQDVGIRLSAAGRAVAYNEPSVYYTGPIPTGATLSEFGSSVNYTISADIRYKNIVGKLYNNWEYGFELSCVSDSGDEWIGGTVNMIIDNSVTVYFPKCPSDQPGKYIRYAWRQNPCVFMKCAIYASGVGYPFPSPPFLIPIN